MSDGFALWLTGLSGAGKSTIARGLAAALRARGRRAEVLDGDAVREHLSQGLGFSRADRDTNVRRIVFVADLLARNGVVPIVAAISPYREARDAARAQIGAFVEVYVRCALDTVVQRDVKGLYARAVRGEIAQFTGVSDPYEEPLVPEVVVDTDREAVDESVARILAGVEQLGYLAPAEDRAAGGRLAADEIASLARRFVDAAPQDVLRWALATFPRERLAIGTSFQADGIAILDMAWRIDPRVRAFTIDTGRLPPETYALIEEVRARYGIEVEVYWPEPGDVERLVRAHGPNLFYQSVPLRLACCEVRKVRPAQRVLRGLDAWITGLRRDQWRTRAAIEVVEADAEHGGIVKVNPLAHWTEAQVWDYVRAHDVPVHPLYALGYTSIGCAPCTRPVAAGEDARGALVVGDKYAQGVRDALHDRASRGAARPGGGVMSLRADDHGGAAVAERVMLGDGPGANAALGRRRLTHLDALEAEAVFILRETAAECARPVLLFSGGKDSAVLLRLAEKAFRPGRFPFPIMHIDTGHNFPEALAFRDRRVAELGERLIVRTVQDSIDRGRVVEERGPRASRNRLQTTTLLDTITELGFDAAIGGARRDEEKARAKERVFSFRDAFGQWDPRHQRPELWQLYNARVRPGEHVRVFPISNWTEMDVWQYVAREQMDLPSIYYAHERRVFERDGMLLAVGPYVPLLEGEAPFEATVRFRTVGDMTCTGAVRSTARTVPEVIAEVATAQVSERGATRADDRTSDSAMEDRKREGYF
jgi:sulfate adenylyltransferase subunit 2